MGAQEFCHTIDAFSIGEAFDRLTERAVYEKGHDMYNGTISTCSLGRCKKTFDKPTQKNIKAAYKLIEELDGGDKWVAHYIDLGVVGYRKTTAKRISKKGAVRPKIEYCVIDNETGKRVSADAHYKDQKSACEKATKCAEQGKWVSVVLDAVQQPRTSNVVAEFKPEITTARKPKTCASNVKALHRYIIFGWASF